MPPDIDALYSGDAHDERVVAFEPPPQLLRSQRDPLRAAPGRRHTTGRRTRASWQDPPLPLASRAIRAASVASFPLSDSLRRDAPKTRTFSFGSAAVSAVIGDPSTGPCLVRVLVRSLYTLRRSADGFRLCCEATMIVASEIAQMSHRPTHDSQAIDPVCGMSVDRANPSGGSATHDGTAYYFCCDRCREQFVRDPVRFIEHKPQLLTIQTAPAKSDASAPVEYTCPMHPEIIRKARKLSPCGMALEPRTATALDDDNPELADMTRRFWIGLALTVPVFALAMGGMLFSFSLQGWIEMALASPVVLWAGWPFFVRMWASSSTAARTCSR